VSTFADRIAQRWCKSRRKAEQKSDAELEAKMAADPHREPPSSRRRRSSSPAPAETKPAPREDPIPVWILRRAYGIPLPGDPGAEDAEVVTAWPADVLSIVGRVKRLEPGDLPPAPFLLNPWTRITNAERWLEGIRAEVDLGPNSARARTGVLREVLRYLAPLIDAKGPVFQVQA